MNKLKYNFPIVLGGRYSVFPSGVLHIRDVGKQDIYRYKCQTKHILTHSTKMSASSGHLIVTGDYLTNIKELHSVNYKRGH